MIPYEKDKFEKKLADMFCKDEVPADHLDFDSIYQKTRKTHLFGNSNSQLLKIAAVITLLVGVAGMFFMINTKDPQHSTPIVNTKDPDPILDSLPPQNLIPKQKKPDIVDIEKSKQEFPKEQPEKSKTIPKKLKKSTKIAIIPIKKYSSSSEIQSYNLPDESTVILKKGSQLTYAQSEKNRRSITMKGNVYFEVVTDKKKPFQIKGVFTKVTVTGTAFVMSSESNSDHLTLLEGSVSVEHLKTKKIVELSPGQSFYSDAQEIQLLELPPNHFAWKTKSLHFQNQKIKHVFDDIENGYDITIKVEDPGVLECFYNASFQHKSPEQILPVIAATLQLSLKKEGTTYILQGKNNCL